MYTNKGLVNHAEGALKLNTKYMWGGLLRPITPNYIQMLRSMYGTKAGTGYTNARYAQLQNYVNRGYYGVDCVGLIKSYYWSGKPNGGVGSPEYGKAGYPDVNAGVMYQQSKKKGKIQTMPEVPGLIVYSKSHPHVGIYVGNGYTIESTLGTRGDGVVKRKLDKFWQYWFECPYIEYIYDTQNTTNTKETKNTKVQKVEVGFPAIIRSKPTKNSSQLGKYAAGTKIQIVVGTETKDNISGFIYIKVNDKQEKWIVKSALK